MFSTCFHVKCGVQFHIFHIVIIFYVNCFQVTIMFSNTTSNKISLSKTPSDEYYYRKFNLKPLSIKLDKLPNHSSERKPTVQNNSSKVPILSLPPNRKISVSLLNSPFLDHSNSNTFVVFRAMVDLTKNTIRSYSKYKTVESQCLKSLPARAVIRKNWLLFMTM